MQRSGSPLPAGVSTAEVITVLGTGNPEAGSMARLAHATGVTGVAIEVVRVLKSAHWFCAFPSTQLGPRKFVGEGELLTQFRLPATWTRLTSEAPWLTFDPMCRLPPISPSHARQGPALALHSKFPWMTTSGP